MQFKAGDAVYYIGKDKKLQQEYGKRGLTIVAVDPQSHRTVCATTDGQLLVGVEPSEIQSMEGSLETEPVITSVQVAKDDQAVHFL